MATAAYHNWVSDGRPHRLAMPVAIYRSAFYAAGWPNDSIGTLGDEPHLQASTPQDHTPFSVTGWPNAHPYPYVTAIDVSHGVSRETMLDAIVAYWLSQAKAGKTPWVKYIIYKGRGWSVRDGWAQRPASGHFDHVHVSMRTDYVSTSVGDWQPLGTNNGGHIMWEEILPLPSAEFPELLGQTQEKAGLILAWTGARVRRQEVEMTQMRDSVATILSRLEGISAPDTQALAQALADNPTFIDRLADAIVSRTGPSPTVPELVQALRGLTFRGEVE